MDKGEKAALEYLGLQDIDPNGDYNVHFVDPVVQAFVAGFRSSGDCDPLRAERDLAVEALQTIDKAPGTYRGNLLVIARKALAQLPHAGERARLVAAVLGAVEKLKEWHYVDATVIGRAVDAVCKEAKALDAFDRAQGGGKQ